MTQSISYSACFFGFDIRLTSLNAEQSLKLMECETRFVWIIILCVLCRATSVDSIALSKGPDDKTIYEGDTVTFECIVAAKGASRILWVFGGARFISVDTDIFAYSDHTGFHKRCSIINDFEGQYKLQIFNVSRSDEGIFECYYSRNGLTGNFGEPGGARLTVLELGTNSPICSIATADSPLSPYQKVVLNCLSASQDFAVKWDNGTDVMTRFQYGRQLFEVILTPYDNGRVFTCTEVNPATYKTRNCSVKPMNVLPTADIFPILPELTVDNDITFVCHASGLPNIVKYVWIHNGYEIARGIFYPMKYDLGGDGRTLTIRGVEMTDHQSSIVCQAYVRSGLYGVTRTTMIVNTLPVGLNLSTNKPLTTPLTVPQSTFMTTELISGILREDDGHEPIRMFAPSLPAVVATVIGIGIFIIVSGSMLMLVCHPKPKSMLDLPDVTARRRRIPRTFIPSLSDGISHNNFIYAELLNEIDFQIIAPVGDFPRQSSSEEDVFQPLIDENVHSFPYETQHAPVAPPLPPKPMRLIAPDIYMEIPEAINERNAQPSQTREDEIMYCDTELPVRSSSETTDNLLHEPDDICQIPDSAALIVGPNISEYCHSKNTKRRPGNIWTCGCDEQSRTTCPSYARVKKANKSRPKRICGDHGLGNLERSVLIPLKCDDLTSVELYDAHTPLLDIQTEQEFCLNRCYSDSIYDVIPESDVEHHHQSMLLPSRRCRSRLRRTNSCPKNNPYEDITGDIMHPGSFVSDLRVAESAPNLFQTQVSTKGHHIYEAVPEKAADILLYKAKSDDILSKASSDSSCDGDSNDYVDMEGNDINNYI